MANFKHDMEFSVATGTTLTQGSGGNTAVGSNDYFTTITKTGAGNITCSTVQAAFGTKSALVSAGAGETAYLRWESLNATSGAMYMIFSLDTLPSSVQTILGYFNGPSVYIHGSNYIQIVNAAGTSLANFSTHTLIADAFYMVVLKFDQGTQTTTTGYIHGALYAIADLTTPIASCSYTSTGGSPAGYSVNAGTTAVTHIRAGKQTSATATLAMYVDNTSLATGTLTLPALPGASVPPVAAWDGTTPTYASAGVVHVKANFTDDGNLLTANASITRQSGPDSPTITPTGSGNNTPAISLDADITMIAGTYVLRAANVDGGALPSNNADKTIYIAPVANSFTPLAAASLGAGSTFGSPASTLSSVSDSDDATGIRSTASPVAEVLGPFTMPYHPAGASITCKRRLSIEDDAAPAAIARFKFYKNDGTTLIDTAPDLTVSSESPTDFDYPLSPAAHAAVPLDADRTGLKYTITVNP